MKNKLFASEINGLIATFVILFILQFKSNLLPLYFPLLLLITVIGYFKKRLIHLIVLLNLSFIYLTINQVSQMFSGNQLNYLSTIMKENFGIFELQTADEISIISTKNGINPVLKFRKKTYANENILKIFKSFIDQVI